MLFSQNNPKRFYISERLRNCASFVPKGAFICDIGSDHAQIPIYLLLNSSIDKIIITDINKLPLRHAESEMQKYSLSDKAIFIETDGIIDTLKYNLDGFIIAGMSGETIISILDRAKNDIISSQFFVLQPMSRDQLLRKYLYENGFYIESEKCTYENGKVFISLFCHYNIDNIKALSDIDYYLGKYFDTFDNESRKQYLSQKRNSVLRIIEGKDKANLPHIAESKILNYINERL